MISVFLQCIGICVSNWFQSAYAQLCGAKGEHIIQYSAIIAGFISITVPIALDIVSKQTEDFKDREISQLFLKHWLYRFQIYINLLIVVISILLLALDVKGAWMIVIIGLDLIAIVVFVFFLRLVQQFATNFTDYYSTKLKNKSDEIVRGK